MTILKLHHAQVSIPTGEEQKARDFYCSVLGLKEIEKPESLKGRGGFWVQLSDVQMHFGVENGVDRKATRSHLAYQVSDLSIWRARFSKHGIDCAEGIPIPGMDRFEIQYPFGNRIEFLQLKTEWKCESF